MISVQTAESILNSDMLLTGMRKYRKIMDALYWTDVSADREFQRTFNDFFVMRSRPGQYYEKFYAYLEQKKNTGTTFEETLNYLYGAEGRFEISFSSKLIHVINPNRPIWDKIVAVEHFRMRLPGYSVGIPARRKEIIQAYHEFCSRFYEALESGQGQAVLRLFNDKYPHTGFTDAKKLDFLLWADRD